MDDHNIGNIIADMLKQASENAEKELNSKDYLQARFNRAQAILQYIDIKGEKLLDMYDSADSYLKGAFTDKEIEAIKVMLHSIMFTFATDRDLMDTEMRSIAKKLDKMGFE